MQTEIEAKFPDINLPDFRKKLQKNGAQLLYEEQLMRRCNFDFPDHRLDHDRSWVRVRDEGHKVTLSLKQLQDRTLHGTKEIELVVDNFETTCLFLERLGLIQKSYQETRREAWQLAETIITLDTWPWIPSFVELESGTEQELRKVATLLHLNWTEALHGSVETVYQQHYDFSEQEIDSWPEITFTPIPDWLAQRKRSQ